MFRRTALAKYNIIVPRPHGSEPGSQPTRDCEGRRVTTEKLSPEGAVGIWPLQEVHGTTGHGQHAGEYDGLIQGLLATLGHQGWDCRGHGDSEGLQGIMVAYRGTTGSESCGLGIIL